MIDYISMGKRIRKFREAKGWSQSELAYQVQMSNTTISHIEVGSGKPELNTVVRISNALGVSLDMILCESLSVSLEAYQTELSEQFKDCTTAELRFLNTILPSILEAYRRARSDLANKEQ